MVRYIYLLTYKIRTVFDFDMFHNRLIPALQEGRHTIYAIIHSLTRSTTAAFPKSVV